MTTDQAETIGLTAAAAFLTGMVAEPGRPTDNLRGSLAQTLGKAASEARCGAFQGAVGMSPGAQQLAIAVGTGLASKVTGSPCSRRCRNTVDAAEGDEDSPVNTDGLGLGAGGPADKDTMNTEPAAGSQQEKQNPNNNPKYLPWMGSLCERQLALSLPACL